MADHRVCVLAAFVLSTSVSCAQQPMSASPRFEWLPSVSAPAGYPMQVVRGTLTLADGQKVDIPSGAIVQNGWGGVGSVEIRGAPGPKAWPARLEATWYSFTEDRFFSLAVAVPPAEVESVLAAAYPHPRTGERGSFSTVLVGVAPGGTASLWLAGNGVVRRVARWRASEVPGRWADILDDDRTSRAEYVRAVLERRLGREALDRLARDGAPRDWWDHADDLVTLRLAVVGAPTVRFAWLRGVNGEHEYLDSAAVAKATATLRAAPARLDVGWLASDGQRRRAVIELDEQASLAALDQVRQDATAAVFQLVVDLQDTAQTGGAPIVSLRSPQLRIKLPVVSVRITAS